MFDQIESGISELKVSSKLKFCVRALVTRYFDILNRKFNEIFITPRTLTTASHRDGFLTMSERFVKVDVRC